MSSPNQNSAQYECRLSVNDPIVAVFILPTLTSKAVKLEAPSIGQMPGRMLTSNLLSAQLYEPMQLVDAALIANCAAKARI
ncbi:hypothetical protein LPU83_pLPU83d_0978 (plasmid) [Rhizobium favelukesii]|uniref:Uncharacterized protein n=1 Tax=Rhizobium favelukesii TaxID=348824 RepID=W6RUI7_9HYPH|nr:hypothetical protein LPU83_pLPU83d_0978 [Rhizobium favelukesii]